MNKLNIVYLILLILVTLYSCKKEATTNTPTAYTDTLDLESLEDTLPTDSILAKKYKRSCYMCHNNIDAQAPLAKNKTEWKKRLDEKGLDLLLEHTINGYNAMPVKGQCLDCTDKELENLIKFMADLE